VTLLVSCTVAFQVFVAGQQQTLRLDAVTGVEQHAEKGSDILTVDFSGDKQLQGYEVLDGNVKQVPGNDCLYLENPCKLGFYACPGK